MFPVSPARPEADTFVTALANGARVLVIRLPHARTAAVSAFVRCGSAHESRAENGICHVVEHLVFKGSATRDARRINLDAERLGAEVNAHTDKDHTAFHMRGLPGHVPAFVAQLGDILGAPAFPAADLERERQVLLHECTEDEEDPMSTAFKLFDRACFGAHGQAQSVIGPRRNLERFTREQLAAWVQAKYTAANLVIAAIGPLDPAEVLRAAEAAFGGFAPGAPNLVEPAAYVGGLAAQRDSGSSQAHAVIGWPLPPAAHEDAAAVVAAAVLGEGMSSPLLDRVREQNGLAYYTHCSADVLEHAGQFVVEASTGPKQWEQLVSTVLALVREQAGGVDPADLERALNQLRVRRLRDDERPQRRLEAAALDLFVHGRVRPAAETLAAWEAVRPADVQAAFARMLAAGTSVALSGELPRAASQRLKEVVSAALAD